MYFMVEVMDSLVMYWLLHIFACKMAPLIWSDIMWESRDPSWAFYMALNGDAGRNVAGGEIKPI